MIKRNEFFLPGGRAGILLIHGLTGTPTEMRTVGRALNQAGFTVCGMQLAGHCGDVDDLIATTWQDWAKSVEDAANEFSQQVDVMFIGGLSMGAVLALNYASDHPHKVKGILAYSPTFHYDGWTIPKFSHFLSSTILYITGWTGIGKRLMFNEKPPYGIKNEVLRRKIVNSMNSGDSSEAGLPGNPWASLYQVKKLSAHVKKKLINVTAPCLALHSNNDDIAHHRNAELIREKINGKTDLVLLENSYHMITIDNDRAEVINRSIDFMNQQLSEPMQPLAKNT